MLGKEAGPGNCDPVPGKDDISVEPVPAELSKKKLF